MTSSGRSNDVSPKGLVDEGTGVGVGAGEGVGVGKAGDGVADLVVVAGVTTDVCDAVGAGITVVGTGASVCIVVGSGVLVPAQALISSSATKTKAGRSRLHN